jgi:hypothetical protein
MVRTTGFIFGVCLVVVAFLLVLQPDGAPQPPVLTTPETAQTPADDSRAVASVTQPPDPERAPVADTLQRERSAQRAPTPQTGDDEGPADSSPPTPGAIRSSPDGQDRTDPDSPAKITNEAAGNYLFWSPFRSAWAAAGFAGRLSAATDVPVEVIESGPGAYRVGFRYHDEAERRARVDLIEAVTGLELE